MIDCIGMPDMGLTGGSITVNREPLVFEFEDDLHERDYPEEVPHSQQCPEHYNDQSKPSHRTPGMCRRMTIGHWRVVAPEVISTLNGRVIMKTRKEDLQITSNR